MANRPLMNIFAPDRKVTVLVTVVRRLKKAKYLVQDRVGRQLIAAAPGGEFYPPQAQLVVQGGQIVRSGRRIGTVQRMEV